MNTPINYVRGFGAVFVGFLAMAGLNMILIALLQKFLSLTTMDALTTTQTLCLLAATALSGFVGGFIAAALAGDRRWQHAVVLAGVILGIGVLGLLVQRDTPRSAYTVYALVLSPLSILAGGWLRHFTAK